MQTVLVIIISYLLGSIPTSDIVARLAGVDIRSTGSGNPGFTNVLRTLGARVATPVLIIDIAKGLVAVLLVADVLGAGSPLGPTAIRLIAGMSAVAGHIWPVFAKFKGGRGVATACGVFGAMAPFATLVAVVVWLALVLTTRYVSVGSVVASMLLPWAIWFEARLTGRPAPVALTLTAAVVALVVVVRHRANIGRLMKGTENRFGRSQDHGGKA